MRECLVLLSPANDLLADSLYARISKYRFAYLHKSFGDRCVTAGGPSRLHPREALLRPKFTPALKPSMTLSDLREATMAKGRRGLDRRHRDRSGKIEKKHGNTRIGSL